MVMVPQQRVMFYYNILTLTKIILSLLPTEIQKNTIITRQEPK